MKKAYLFPGQGSQFVGMGLDLYESDPGVKQIYDAANQILGMDLAHISFRGPEEDLKQTRITQPAIFVHSMAVFHLLNGQVSAADAVAGHSLGEYSSLVSAGALSFEEGLQLVKIRGGLMQKAGTIQPGTMGAIIGLDIDSINQICETVKPSGIACPANFNSPGQVVISGDVAAVREAMHVAKDKGAKRAIELVVSGAFHSPLMESATTGLSDALEKAEIKDARIPVYSNVEAKPVRDKGEIRELLLKQLTHPVRWEEIIRNMVADQIQSFYEIGPGKVLCGLNKRIIKDLPCATVGTKAEIQQLSSR